MRIAVFGGTGFIGGRLVPELLAAGHEIVLLARRQHSRRIPPAPRLRRVPLDRHYQDDWAAALDGCDAVANLSGASVGRPWTSRARAEIRESRVHFTAEVVETIAGLENRPRVLVNASGIGFYGDRGDDIVDESEPPGDDWLANLAVEWEAAAQCAEQLGLRVVRLRTALVFGHGGGSLPKLALPFRLFVGGPIGSGRQWYPWVHVDDIARIYRLALEDDRLTGPVDAGADAVRSAELAATLGRVLHRPSWMPAPAFALRLAFPGFAETLLAGQRPSFTKLAELGFTPKWPQLEDALRQALRR